MGQNLSEFGTQVTSFTEDLYLKKRILINLRSFYGSSWMGASHLWLLLSPEDPLKRFQETGTKQKSKILNFSLLLCRESYNKASYNFIGNQTIHTCKNAYIGFFSP